MWHGFFPFLVQWSGSEKLFSNWKSDNVKVPRHSAFKKREKRIYCSTGGMVVVKKLWSRAKEKSIIHFGLNDKRGESVMQLGVCSFRALSLFLSHTHTHSSDCPLCNAWLVRRCHVSSSIESGTSIYSLMYQMQEEARAKFIAYVCVAPWAMVERLK